MVALIEKQKPKSSYKSPLNITDDIRASSERREQRAKELDIALYILGDDPKKDDELQRLEDYIVENFIDLDLDVPNDIKEKYLAMRKSKDKYV
ncbi:MAG: hypothetical protein K5868_09815 [Lachnospiraceae bacterium]|nr:hypothetical protein [Lachnospiraceae bacterium]